MKILSLEMKNIRSYVEERIDFPEGNILFEGDIGSGKSTILMAVEFALFGLGDTRGDSLLRVGEDRGSVTLRFSVDGKEYEVHRELERSKRGGVQQTGNSYIVADGRKQVLSATELRSKVIEILGFNEPQSSRSRSLIFRYAVFTPQEEMKNILSLRQDERLQTLRRAFHIEDYKIARDNAEYVKRALDLERQAEETLSKGLEERQREIGDLKERKGELERSLQKVRSEMEALNERLRAIMEDETMADSALREVSDRISKLEQLGDSKKRIEAELRKLEDDRRKAAEEIRRLERKKGEVVAEDPGIGLEEARAREDEINRRLKAVTEEIASLDGERRAVEARIKGKQDALRKDEERLSRIRSTRSEIQGRLEGLGAVEIEGDESELNSRLREIERDIDRATLEIGTLSNQIENFRRLEETGVCPTCRRPVSRGEYESERVRHQDELKKAEEKRDALRAEKDEISRRLDSIREMRMKLGERRHLEEQLEVYREQEKEVSREIGEIRDELEKYSGELERLRSEIEKRGEEKRSLEDNLRDAEGKVRAAMNYQRAMSEVREISARLESLEVEVRRMDEQIKAKREEIERYAADLQPLENLRLERVRREKELQDLRDRERSTVGAIRELTGTISSKETEMASLDREIQRAQSELDERVAHRDRARKIGSIVTWIEGFFIPAVESIEKQVMYALNQEFNHHLRRWFSTLVDDHSKDIRVDESFTPIVEQDGFEMDVNYLSGGEKTSVALSYRLALNTLVRSTSTTRKPDTLILDEPTDGFSIQQLYRMRDILMQMNIPQIIIVSHENELESFADHIVRVMKEGDVSRVIV